MDYAVLILSATGIVTALLCLYLFRKSGRFFASLFLSAVSGIGGMLAVNLLGTVTGVTIPFNGISAAFSSLTGLSGVIFLVLWQIFLIV